MLFDKFVVETKNWWEDYLHRIAAFNKAGQIHTNGHTILYPNMVLATNTRGYLVAELIGAKRKFEGLTIKKHKDSSIYRYLSQFDESEPDPLLKMDGSRQRIRFLSLAQDYDYTTIKERFPFIELYQSGVNRVGGRGSVLGFGNNFISCAIENSVLINRHNNIYRCKNILALFIVKNSISSKMLIELFEHSITQSEVRGVHLVSDEDDESLIVGGHLQSMYLLPRLRETTIGAFISTHPAILKKAFKTSHFVYEAYLEWIEHDGTVKDVAINPDLMVKRNDGFYDIYDLKTAALEKPKITKGKRNRRRFIDYVEEGAAQLANYREYFEYPKNRELAQKKYGIDVHNPKLTLVVGSWENAKINEIEQACRRYKDLTIVDFDTMVHLFIGTRQ